MRIQNTREDCSTSWKAWIRKLTLRHLDTYEFISGGLLTAHNMLKNNDELF